MTVLLLVLVVLGVAGVVLVAGRAAEQTLRLAPVRERARQRFERSRPE